ncbi:bromodomain-containing protein [Toxoplasma gondii GAB2-2007-GAL-DOM2]|uniref:Bromodomain-containing protein n=5 Tax=Toxoplasma gondii TaxID=5811 RepID=S7UIF0_TOXGG|nr:bromodomain-containing protein [Toxoplasma gondii GT1]KAF4644797.1 bromodomain-containing protein [Toxoplasma gondii]KFG30195.1 bromodomain-containing protein [Toxoplasma gondii p89]KFG33573.1 bromodomain-containing protein [Toxoplasma gondii GAB2-2007-GAL-DOM2]KFG44843.1 bromodomain-containing protein [Toxoplasma gondii FOU]
MYTTMSAPPSIPLFPPPGSTAGYTFSSPAPLNSGGHLRAGGHRSTLRLRPGVCSPVSLGSRKRPPPGSGNAASALTLPTKSRRSAAQNNVPATRSTRAATAAFLQHSGALQPSQSDSASGVCTPYRVGQVLTDALNRLQKKDKKQIFAAAVDKTLVPDYYVVIKEPMFFDKMKQKIRDRAYKTLDAFNADVELIISNCRLYNHPDTPYCRVAALVETCWHKLRERVKVKFAAAAAADSADEAVVAALKPASSSGSSLSGRGFLDPATLAQSAARVPGDSSTPHAASDVGSATAGAPGGPGAPGKAGVCGDTLAGDGGSKIVGASSKAGRTLGAAGCVQRSDTAGKQVLGAGLGSPRDRREELFLLLRMAADPTAAAKLEALQCLDSREQAGEAPGDSSRAEGPADATDAGLAKEAKAKETLKESAGPASTEVAAEARRSSSVFGFEARQKDPFFWAPLVVPHLLCPPSLSWTQTLGPVEYVGSSSPLSLPQKTQQPLYHKSIQAFLGEETLARLEKVFPDTTRELQKYAQHEALWAPLNDLRIFGVDTADFPEYNSKLSVDHNYLLGVGEGHVQAAATLGAQPPASLASPSPSPESKAPSLDLSCLQGLVQKQLHRRNPQRHPKPKPPGGLLARCAAHASVASRFAALSKLSLASRAADISGGLQFSSAPALLLAGSEGDGMASRSFAGQTTVARGEAEAGTSSPQVFPGREEGGRKLSAGEPLGESRGDLEALHRRVEPEGADTLAPAAGAGSIPKPGAGSREEAQLLQAAVRRHFDGLIQQVVNTSQRLVPLERRCALAPTLQCRAPGTPEVSLPRGQGPREGSREAPAPADRKQTYLENPGAPSGLHAQRAGNPTDPERATVRPQLLPAKPQGPSQETGSNSGGGISVGGGPVGNAPSAAGVQRPLGFASAASAHPREKSHPPVSHALSPNASHFASLAAQPPVAPPRASPPSGLSTRSDSLAQVLPASSHVSAKSAPHPHLVHSTLHSPQAHPVSPHSNQVRAAQPHSVSSHLLSGSFRGPPPASTSSLSLPVPSASPSPSSAYAQPAYPPSSLPSA